jgi:hypothetical protein
LTWLVKAMISSGLIQLIRIWLACGMQGCCLAARLFCRIPGKQDRHQQGRIPQGRWAGPLALARSRQAKKLLSAGRWSRMAVKLQVLQGHVG